MNALAGNVGALGAVTASDLVELVEKHDAMLFNRFQCLCLEFFLVEHLCRLFIGQHTKRFFDLELASFAAVVAEILEHPLQLAGHFFHARRRHDLYTDRQGLDVDLDFFVVELSFAQHFAKFLASVAVG